MNKPLNEVLDIADKMNERIHENAEFMLKKAEEKGNKEITLQGALVAALITEIASIAYAVKQLQNKIK